MISSAYASTVPIQGSEVARQWDHLYFFLVSLSAIFFVLVVGAMVYFAIKYRYRPGVKSTYLTGSHLLEAVWIGVPTALLMVIFAWGYVVYRNMVTSPMDPYEVRVIGKQWLWQFQYDNGRTTTADLYVPLNRPVKLIMSSEDVLHSMFIPGFRIKQDVVPGMYTSVWFEANTPGRFQIFCAEYCGTAHSGMLGSVNVLTPEQWELWSRGKELGAIPDAGGKEGDRADAMSSAQSAPERFLPTQTLAHRGRKVFETRGCVACHSVDGSQKVGPTLSGLYGKSVALQDGNQVEADDNYVRESIENPNAKLVRGYTALMPTFKGLISETEMGEVIAYVKSLRSDSSNQKGR